MNNMEIKQGDKVRVSKDAPELYTDGTGFDWINQDSEITLIEGEDALIDSCEGHELPIPVKYLVKVDAEAEEPKRIFYGDYARMASQSLEELKRKAHPEWYSSTEPTEHTEAEEDTRIRQMEAGLDEFRKAELDRVLHPEKYYTYEVTIDNVAMDWQRYEADLAKEVVLKTVNSASDRRPSAIAEYATDIAKAVVDGLKRM